MLWHPHVLLVGLEFTRKWFLKFKLHYQNKIIILWYQMIMVKYRITKMRIWHWKSLWKVQPHWNITETILKFFKNITTLYFLLITLTFNCLLLLFKKSPYNHTETYCNNFSVTISVVLSNFSVTLIFQFDFQCHIFIVKDNLIWPFAV